MARIVSIGSALQDIFLIDHDDFGTNTKGFFNQLELGAKVDIDKIKYSTGGGATNAATTFARNGHESIFFGCISRDGCKNCISVSSPNRLREKVVWRASKMPSFR